MFYLQYNHHHPFILFSYFIGLSSLFTIASMAWVRYLSVVRLERSWHCQTRNGFWSSPHIWKVWGISLLFVVPPLVGFGEYTMDASTIWYKLLFSKVSVFLSRIAWQAESCVIGLSFLFQLHPVLVSIDHSRYLL